MIAFEDIDVVNESIHYINIFKRISILDFLILVCNKKILRKM